MRARPQMTRIANATVVVAVLATLLVMLSRDPYSYGHMGGEYRVFDEHANIIAMHPWQVWITILMMALLVIAGIQHLLGAYRHALACLVLEFLVFGSANLVYVLRDGWELRRTMGDEGSAVPGIVTASGLIMRIILIAIEAYRVASSRRAVP